MLFDDHESEERARAETRRREEDDRLRYLEQDIQAHTAYLRMRLGDQHVRAGHVRRAIAEYKRAVKLDKHNAQLRTRLGDAYVLAEMVAQALAQYHGEV